MKRFLLLLSVAVLALSNIAFAQSRTITGTVTDERGDPLAGASVIEKGTNNGTTTDQRGVFNLSVRSSNNNQNPIIVISYAGMATQEIPIGNANHYSAILRTGGAELSEVVVTALGIRREKKSLGYSAQEVNAEELAQSRQPNIVNALQGRATGLQINSTGGAPGQGARIVMRGLTSLDPSRPFQPLFIVDGIPIDNTTDETTGGGRGMSNRAADINPDDIESISVLKGGAATALYGLRASNGAVIITTKTGKTGKLRASFTSTYGIENVNKYPEVQKTFTQGYLGVYDSKSFWPSWGPTLAAAKAIDPTHPDQLFNNYERGYQQGNFFRNTLNLSGGTEKALFGAAISQYTHSGVMPFNDYKNYSIKVNGDLKFSEKFRVGGSVNFIKSGGDRKNADRYNEQLSYWAPRWDVRDYIKEDGTMKYYGLENDQPMYVAYGRRFKDDVNRAIGNLTFTYSPVKWLDIMYRAGGDVYTDARTQRAPAPRGLVGEFHPTGDFGFGFVEEYSNNVQLLNSTSIINIKKGIGSLISSSLKIGHDIYSRKSKAVYAFGDTLVVPEFYNLRNAKRVTGSNIENNYRIVGVFADWTLGFKELLYATLTGRNDWTSTLPEENRSFFYPSASLSYILSQHIDLPDVFSYVKLRGSIAKIGKDALPYSTSSGYNIGTGLSNNVLPFTLSDRTGDAKLRPEFTVSKEGGAEIQFFKNRVGLDFTYYNNKSEDQIIPVKVPISSGYDEIYLNAGAIRNKGVELSLSGAPIRQNDLNWNVRINFTKNESKVLEIYPGLTEIPILTQFGYLSSAVTQKFIPGMPVGALFGRSYARYYGSDKEDVIFIDNNRPMLISTNGFPVINTKQMYLGNTQPDWIGSIYNDFQFKQFGISFLFDAQQGLQKYNQLSNFMAAFGIAKYTENRTEMKVFEGVLSNGTPNTKQVYLGQGKGPDNVDYGNGYYRNVYRGVSENFIEDASFVKLRNVTLSYQIPSQLISKTRFISGANISASGNNLWLKTKYTGFDPESSSFGSGSIADGFAGFTYPQTRSFMMTINLTF